MVCLGLITCDHRSHCRWCQWKSERRIGAGWWPEYHSWFTFLTDSNRKHNEERRAWVFTHPLPLWSSSLYPHRETGEHGRQDTSEQEERRREAREFQSTGAARVAKSASWPREPVGFSPLHPRGALECCPVGLQQTLNVRNRDGEKNTGFAGCRLEQRRFVSSAAGMEVRVRVQVHVQVQPLGLIGSKVSR